MKYVVTLNGKKYEVEVEKGQANTVYVGEAVQEVAPAPVVETAAAPVVATPSAPQATGAGDPIKAPMPGTILEVKVSPNQAVKKGEVLFILEAMKMENEIVAPRDGTITSVVVTKGASVQTDQAIASIQ